MCDHGCSDVKGGGGADIQNVDFLRGQNVSFGNVAPKNTPKNMTKFFKNFVNIINFQDL